MNSHLGDFHLSLDDEIIIRNSFTNNNQITTYYADQYHKGMKVLGKGANIQVYGGLLSWIDADFKQNLAVDTSNVVSSDSAISVTLDNLSADTFSWQNDTFEYYYKLALEDTNATSYPKPKKVIIQQNNVWISAWEVKVIALNSTDENNTTSLINAKTGEYLYSIGHKEGCSIFGGSYVSPYYGNRSITVCRINANKFKLYDPARKIHTKEYKEDRSYNKSTKSWELNGSAKSWLRLDNYKNSNANWGYTDDAATSAHWTAEIAYDYYDYHWNRPAVDGSNRVETRIYAESPYDGSWAYDGDAHDDHGGSNNGTKASVFSIEVGTHSGSNNTPAAGNTLADLETVAHEYTHGHQFYTSQIGKFGENGDHDNESGALKEAFCDIMSVIVEQSKFGGPIDWRWSEKPENSVEGLRNFKTGLSARTGYVQALRVGGPNWQSNWDSDDRYINMGVINKWFQLLTDGTASEPGGKYRGYSIGNHSVYDVSWIAYYTMVYLNKTSEYIDARQLSIMLAEDERTFTQGGPNSPNFGKCKQLWRDVHKAWAAVGVGNGPPNCAQIAVNRENTPCAFVAPLSGHTVFVPVSKKNILSISFTPTFHFNNSHPVNITWGIPSGLTYSTSGDTVTILSAEDEATYTITLEQINSDTTIISYYDLEVYNDNNLLYTCIFDAACQNNSPFISRQHNSKNYSQERVDNIEGFSFDEDLNLSPLDFTIVPNPSKGIFKCQIVNSHTPTTISIYGLDGSLVYQLQDITSTTAISLEDIRTGLYSVVVRNEAETKVKRIQILH